MHRLTWTDKQGTQHELKFGNWKFAKKMSEYLEGRGYPDVVLITERRDAHRVNLRTQETFPLARNRSLSRLSIEIKNYLAEHPDMSVIITPSNKKSG